MEKNNISIRFDIKNQNTQQLLASLVRFEIYNFTIPGSLSIFSAKYIGMSRIHGQPIFEPLSIPNEAIVRFSLNNVKIDNVDLVEWRSNGGINNHLCDYDMYQYNRDIIYNYFIKKYKIDENDLTNDNFKSLFRDLKIDYILN